MADPIIKSGAKVVIRNSPTDRGVIAEIHNVILNRFNDPIRIECAESGGKLRFFTKRRANGDYVERDTPTFSGPWLYFIWHPSQGPQPHH